MKIHPKDLPENIRKHYQVHSPTGGKVGLIFKAIKKNHTTIVVWSKNHTKEAWHKTSGQWVLQENKHDGKADR
jgi:hypothetical protein